MILSFDRLFSIERSQVEYIERYANSMLYCIDTLIASLNDVTTLNEKVLDQKLKQLDHHSQKLFLGNLPPLSRLPSAIEGVKNSENLGQLIRVIKPAVPVFVKRATTKFFDYLSKPGVCQKTLDQLRERLSKQRTKSRSAKVPVPSAGRNVDPFDDTDALFGPSDSEEEQKCRKKLVHAFSKEQVKKSDSSGTESEKSPVTPVKKKKSQRKRQKSSSETDSSSSEESSPVKKIKVKQPSKTKTSFVDLADSLKEFDSSDIPAVRKKELKVDGEDILKKSLEMMSTKAIQKRVEKAKTKTKSTKKANTTV